MEVETILLTSYFCFEERNLLLLMDELAASLHSSP